MTDQIPHLLLTFEPKPIKNWGEWVSCWAKAWDETTSPELLAGLLHVGFGVRASGPGAADRICLYLDLADGYGSDSNFRSPERRLYLTWAEETPLAELRQQLARKAFSLLVSHLFRDQREQSTKFYRPPTWMGSLMLPGVLDRVLRFFSPRELGGIENLSHSTPRHQREIVRQFLLDLCQTAWEYGRYDSGKRSYWSSAWTEPLIQARPRLISLLDELHRLRLLLDENYKLDEACLRQLEKLALGREYYLPSLTSQGDTHRRPRDLAEALYAGSVAAEVLLILRTRAEQATRMNELHEALRAQEEAEERLQKLAR